MNFPKRLLSLDVSTKTGWSKFVDGELADSGQLKPVKVEDFNVNKDPQLSPAYPLNIADAAELVVKRIIDLVEADDPFDFVVIENTNKGRNRHTQRLLEFIHYVLIRYLSAWGVPFGYMDSSEWRRIVGLKLTKEDKKNNRDVSANKKRGRVTKKHLAIRLVEEEFGLKLKVKDNDRADAILLGLAYVKKERAKNGKALEQPGSGGVPEDVQP